MFFSSIFVNYSQEGTTGQEKVKTLDPRDPARGITSHIVVREEIGSAPGFNYDNGYWMFMDRVDFDEFYISDNIVRGGQEWGPFPTHTDPYLGRKRAFIELPNGVNGGFSVHPTAQAQATVTFEVGTLQILRRADGLETNSDLFLTYPFERTLSARTIAQTRVDGSTYERVIGGENRMFMSATVIPTGGYSDEDDAHEKFTGITLASEFFFVSELQPWDMWLFKRTPQSRYRYQTRRYNDQRITLQLEVL